MKEWSKLSLAPFAKATELSTMGKQNQDTSVNGSGFGFFFFVRFWLLGFAFYIIHLSLKYPVF